VTLSIFEGNAMKRFILLIYLLLTACSSLPPTIENPPAFDLLYNSVTQDPTHYKNMSVRWGGIIAEIENEQNTSFIQVLLYPLNNYGRPLLNEQPQGRFVVKSDKFLDPLVYAKKSEITVAGMLTGGINRTIDKKIITLPLVSASTIHLWPDYNYGNYYGGYGYPYGYYPYGGFGGFGGGYYGFPNYGWRGGYYPYWY
jgi:outer membrane lipoprotein